MEVHMSLHNFSSVESVCSMGDAQAVEARVGPSSLVKMWVVMMSRWTAAIEVPSAAEVVEEQEGVRVIFV